MLRSFIRYVLCVSVAAQIPSPDPAAVVQFGSARFTILFDGLVRLEQARVSTTFDDRPSLAIVNRHTAVPQFNITSINATSIRVNTSRLTITYDERGVLPKDACAPQLIVANASQDGGAPVAAYPDGLTTATANECCAACSSDPQCTAWSWLTFPPELNCFLVVGAKSVPRSSSIGTYGARMPPSFPPGSLRIDYVAANGTAQTWTAADPLVAADNLGGSNPFLDCYSTPMECISEYRASLSSGLLSQSYAVFDDTSVARFVPAPSRPAGLDSWWFAPDIDAVDFYFSAFGGDVRAALAAWAAVSGPPVPPPRAALGVWWSRYYAYSETTIVSEVISGYKTHSLPLSYLVLDMNWHTNYFAGEGAWGTCTGWGGKTATCITSL